MRKVGITMQDDINQELNNLIIRITDTVDANTIYLLSSFAYGNPNENSDLDLYVVIPDDSLRPLEATHKIRMAICRD